MRHGAALAGAVLAVGALSLMAGPGSAETVGILTFTDAGCCSISDGSKVQDDRAPANDVANSGSERAGDAFAPDAVALEASAGSDETSPDGPDSATVLEPSVLSRLLMIFADLRASVLGRP